MALFSLIVPFLNERENVPAFTTFIEKVAGELREKFDLDLEVVLVDDGSTDDSVTRYITSMPGTWRIVELSRNFGKEVAVFAGLEECRGDLVMIMDADMQHPWTVALDMISQLTADENLDAVYAVRDDRLQESMKKAAAVHLFYWLINFRQRFIVPENAGDFRVMRRPVVEAMLKIRDRRRFNKGLYAWAGFRQKAIGYVPDERQHGATKWSNLSLLSLSLEGITSFSALPLRLVSIIGALVGLCGIFYGLKIVFEVLFYGVSVPGYPSLMVAVSVLGGFNLALLGLLGEYIWVGIAETKDRPLYLVRRVHRSGDIKTLDKAAQPAEKQTP
jgi:glycosyltransferase involved in cell wall biosynthesis